ncbi:hypothetical protein CBR_g31185 [Chara braunii]|uniref:AAA+ ATPase domain-containing protein n=1 Tax=Chara braunii TaxID=69332 RepID=A0A388JXM7_CHABU|nr:hypothetical protein CBR_g31185 [Chara braunii]|eukprot:GBG62546.1 hypothetical protein CBR_g31185 [Chara braunii]
MALLGSEVFVGAAVGALFGQLGAEITIFGKGVTRFCKECPSHEEVCHEIEVDILLVKPVIEDLQRSVSASSVNAVASETIKEHVRNLQNDVRQMHLDLEEIRIRQSGVVSSFLKQIVWGNGWVDKGLRTLQSRVKDWISKYHMLSPVLISEVREMVAELSQDGARAGLQVNEVHEMVGKILQAVTPAEPPGSHPVAPTGAVAATPSTRFSGTLPLPGGVAATSVCGVVPTHGVPTAPKAAYFPPIPVEGHLYGLDEGSWEVQWTLRHGQYESPHAPSQPRQGPEIVCIHGMGGVGKTTLAKLVHNSEEMKGHFPSGRVWAVCGQLNTGFQVLQGLWRKWWKLTQIGEPPSLDDQIEGESRLNEILSGKKVLVVIDDVWRPSQIDWVERVLPRNCSVIITTRNAGVVPTHGVVGHQVKPLGDRESLKLLCQCAFGTEFPPPELSAVVEQVCQRCGGLPLALRVVGGNLSTHCEDADMWESWLEFLDPSQKRCQIQPGSNYTDFEERVIGVLQRSIDALKRENPVFLDMFLDLVGFPEDYRIPRNVIVALWSIYPTVGDMRSAKHRLEIFIRLSLVEVQDDNHVSLHDMTREAGIFMIRSPSEPPVMLGNLDTLANDDGESTSGGQQRLFLTGNECDGDLVARHVQNVRKLSWVAPEFLTKRNEETGTDVLSSDSWTMPRLVSFCAFWNESDVKFHERCQIVCQQFLRRIAESAELRILLLLNLSPYALVSDWFATLPNLQVLIVEFPLHFQYLPTIFPSSVARLHNLRVLDIRFNGLQPMAVDPVAIEKLAALKVLRIMRFNLLGATDDMSGDDADDSASDMSLPVEQVPAAVVDKLLMPDLEEFVFECKGLRDTGLSPTIGKLTALRCLKVSWCDELTRVPPEIGNLRNLVKLTISHSSLGELPATIGQLQCLTKMVVFVSSLESVPEEIGDLRMLARLDISVAELKAVPTTIGNLSGRLEHLDFACALAKIEEIPKQIGQLTNLRKLDLQGATLITSLPSEISNLHKLKSLGLSECESIEALPDGIAQLTNLELLDLDGCAQLEGLPEEFGNMSKLKELRLNGSGIVELPASISRLEWLRTLHLQDCQQLYELRVELGCLTRLKELYLDASSITEIPRWITNLLRLTKLGLPPVTHLPDEIGDMESLETLVLKKSDITDLPASLGRLHTLTDLDLQNCKQLTRLPAEIGCLSQLERLGLRGSGVVDLPSSISGLQRLAKIFLQECTQLTRLPPELACLPELKEVKLEASGIPELPSWLSSRLVKRAAAKKHSSP